MGAAIAFAYGMTDVAIDSIHFDLRTIGESVYEAHSRDGRWPEQIDDLEGTAYLKMPYRRAALDDGHFEIIWHRDLDPNPAANGDRILAYDNGSLFARLGRVWVCPGDLRIDVMRADEKAALRSGRSGP